MNACVLVMLAILGVPITRECRLYTKEEKLFVDEVWVRSDKYRVELMMVNMVDPNVPVWSDLEYRPSQIKFVRAVEDAWLESSYRYGTPEQQRWMRSKSRCPAAFDKPELVWYRSSIHIYPEGMALGTYDVCFHAVMGDREDYAWIRIHIVDNIPPKVAGILAKK